jgi:hypothetical protein
MSSPLCVCVYSHLSGLEVSKGESGSNERCPLMASGIVDKCVFAVMFSEATCQTSGGAALREYGTRTLVIGRRLLTPSALTRLEAVGWSVRSRVAAAAAPANRAVSCIPKILPAVIRSGEGGIVRSCRGGGMWQHVIINKAMFYPRDNILL